MLGWFRRRGEAARKAEEIYGAVVAQARRPDFYESYGVPDTMRGRYEMLVLNLFLMLERMREDPADTTELSRLTLERFCADMDDCMREIGIGDLAVPKKVKRAAIGFYERAAVYRPAIAADDAPSLAGHLSRFVRDGEAAEATGEMLAGYALRARKSLAEAPLAAVLDGTAFPPTAGSARRATSGQGRAEGER